MKGKIYIFLLLPLFIIACNKEENMQPSQQEAYIKIIQGLGEDNPLAIKQAADGSLVVVSNSTSFEQGTSKNKIRVLKLSLDGEIITQKYYPESLDENWNVRDVVKTSNGRIIMGGTMKNENLVTDTSLFFFEINTNLDSVQFQHYSADNTTYSLAGVQLNENQNELLFIGAEGADNTIYGEIDLLDFSIRTLEKSSKPEALPATSVYKDANQKITWAINSDRLVILKSDKSMRTTEEPNDIIFDDVNFIRTKALMISENQFSVFGDLNSANNENSIFFYLSTRGDYIPIAGDGNTFLNGVNQNENGEYLITGYDDIQTEGQNTQSDFFLSMRGNQGSQIINESFGSDVDEELHDAIKIDNKIYCIGTTIFSGNNTLVLIKTNQYGKFEN